MCLHHDLPLGAYNLVCIKHNNVFRAPYDHFKYNAMSFGLINALTIFQHMTNGTPINKFWHSVSPPIRSLFLLHAEMSNPCIPLLFNVSLQIKYINDVQRTYCFLGLGSSKAIVRVTQQPHLNLYIEDLLLIFIIPQFPNLIALSLTLVSSKEFV